MNIAVLLPCHNEEAAIADVVKDFKKNLPGADIYVYDNASSDKTSEVARKAGAIVRHEPRKGKGNVVRRMFSDIDADIYIMADGDGTYDAKAAPKLIERLVDEQLDMVVGAREHEDDKAYRHGHQFGNRMLNFCVHTIFDNTLDDMLSGYRVFSRRFVKSFPASSKAFEIETEITIHALQLSVPVAEVPTRYFTRAEGTESKLSTYKDGIKILNFILFMFKEGRPFLFFSLLAAGLAFISLVLGLPIVWEYLGSGEVPRFPTAFLSLGIMLSAVICFVCGVILDSVGNMRLETKKLAYLSHKLPEVKKKAVAKKAPAKKKTKAVKKAA